MSSLSQREVWQDGASRPMPFMFQGPEFILSLHKGILKRMSNHLANHPSDEVRTRVYQAREDDIRWHKILEPRDDSRQLDPAIPDLGIWKTEMHTHPLTLIKCNSDLQGLRDRIGTIPGDHRHKEKLDQVAAYLTSANSLKLLGRFVGRGHPSLPVWPNSAGIGGLPMDKNRKYAEHWELQADFYLRRALVRFLHYPGMVRWDEQTGTILDLGLLRNFAEIYSAGRLLLELELERTPADRWTDAFERPLIWDDSDTPKLDFIRRGRTIVLRVLEEIAKIPFDENLPIDRGGGREFFGPQRLPADASREQRFEFNLQYAPGNMADRMIERYGQLMTEHPLERLLLDLLDKEDTFERRLGVEHIEDRLINKQIALLDDDRLVRDKRTDWGVLDYARFHEKEEVKNAENYLYNILPAISLLNRQRRNFRLNREWTKGRPWANIWQLYDTSTPATAWLGPAIQEFFLHIKPAEDATSNEGKTNYASFRAIAPHLFGVLPVNYTKLCAREPGRTRLCKICDVAFHGSSKPASLVASLPCENGHSFHLSCILNYWDAFGKYRQDCPTCGHTPELTAERVGLAEHVKRRDYDFVFNVFGYRDDVPPLQPKYKEGLDIPRDYWIGENHHASVIDDSPLKWPGMIKLGGGQHDSVVRRNGRNPNLQQVADRWRMGQPQRWKQSYDTAKQLARQCGYNGREPLWVVGASRFRSREERAWLRRIRIRRDRARRDLVRQKGLKGLFRK